MKYKDRQKDSPGMVEAASLKDISGVLCFTDLQLSKMKMQAEASQRADEMAQWAKCLQPSLTT